MVTLKGKDQCLTTMDFVSPFSLLFPPACRLRSASKAEITIKRILFISNLAQSNKRGNGGNLICLAFVLNICTTSSALAVRAEGGDRNQTAPSSQLVGKASLRRIASPGTDLQRYLPLAPLAACRLEVPPEDALALLRKRSSSQFTIWGTVKYCTSVLMGASSCDGKAIACLWCTGQSTGFLLRLTPK